MLVECDGSKGTVIVHQMNEFHWQQHLGVVNIYCAMACFEAVFSLYITDSVKITFGALCFTESCGHWSKNPGKIINLKHMHVQ